MGSLNSLFEYTDKLNSPYECFEYEVGPDNFPVRPHWHYFMEIIYITKGTVMITCDEESFIASESDMVLFLPHQVHSIYSVALMPIRYYVLKFDLGQLSPAGISTTISGVNFSAIFRNAKESEGAILSFNSDKLEKTDCTHIFNLMCNEIRKKDYGYGIKVQSCISSLLIDIIRMWRMNGFDTDKALKLFSEEESINTITEYIDDHIQENLKVEELAGLCNMSYPYFAKVFKQMYGQSCKKYIEFVRLCKAENLLLATNMDMNYISQETGFSDCSHFIKAFKEKYNITPKQFRQKQNKKEHITKTLP